MRDKSASRCYVPGTGPATCSVVQPADLIESKLLWDERAAFTATTQARHPHGNMTEAAVRLGLERSHLYKKLKKLGWQPES